MTCFISLECRCFSLTWHCRKNLRNLTCVKRAIRDRKEQTHHPALMLASCTDTCWHAPRMDVKQTYIKMLTVSVCGQEHIYLHGLVSKLSVSMVTAEKRVKIRKARKYERQTAWRGQTDVWHTLCSIKATGQKREGVWWKQPSLMMRISAKKAA